MPRVLNSFGMGALLFVKGVSRFATGMARAGNATAGASNQMAVAGAAMNKTFGRLTKGLALATAGFVSLGVMKKAADEAGEFEFEMAAVRNITSSSAEMMRELNDRTLEAGLSFKQFSPAEAAKGLRLFAQAGFEARTAMDMITPTLDLAAASIGQLGLDEAAGLAVQGVKLFSKDALSATEIMDRLAKATLTSSLQFKDLPLAVGVAARGVVAFGADIDDVMISLGLIRNILPTVERGATALSTTMEKIISPKTIGMIEELGLKYPIKKTDRFLDAIGKLAFGMKDMDDKTRGAWVTTAFGRRSMAGMLVLLRQLEDLAEKAGGGFEGMTKAIEEMRKRMEDSAGTMAKLRGELLSTFKGQKEVLAAATKGALTVVGLQAIIPITKPIVDILSQMITNVALFFKDLPAGLKKALGALVIFLSVITAVVGTVIAFAGAIALIGAAGLSLTGLAEVALIAGAAIAVLVGALVTLSAMWRANAGGIQDKFLPIIEKAALLWKSLSEAIRLGGFTMETWNELSKESNNGILRFVVQVVMLIDRFKKFFSGLRKGFADVWDMIEIGKEFGAIWDMVVDVVMELVDTFLDIGRSIGLLETGTTKSIKSWKEFGVTVGKVLGHVIWVVAKVIRLAIIPFVVMIKFLLGNLRAIFAIGAPLLRFFWKLGEAIYFIITSGPDAAIEALKEAFKSLIQAMAEMVRGVVSTVIRPLVEGLESVLGVFGIETEALTKARKFLKNIETTFAKDIFETEERQARRARIGRVRPRESTFVERALAEFDPGAAFAETVRQPTIGPQDMPGREPIVIETKTTLEMDGETLLEALSRRIAERQARQGQTRRRFAGIPSLPDYSK